jgi:hypothetical protein
VRTRKRMTRSGTDRSILDAPDVPLRFVPCPSGAVRSSTN